MGVFGSSSVLPATIRDLDVSRKHGRFHLVAETYLNAPPAAVYAVLIDYNNDRFGRISEIYKESSYLPPDNDGTLLVYTRVEGCLLFFCRSMRRTERLDTVAPQFIRTTTLPELSDFKYSVSEWRLEPDGAGTRVNYRLDIEPDFWLPPFVGPWFLKRTLLRDGADPVKRIEQLAQQWEAEPVGGALANL